MDFSVQILGCGSALPTLNRNQSAQLITHYSKLYLIDCGEGTQLELRRNKAKIQKINHVFISHLHGDHYFGLIGLISTMHLLGRKDELNIYGPKGLEETVMVHYRITDSKPSFDIRFHIVSKPGQILYEDNYLVVESLPLLHRIPTYGYIFKEKPKKRKLLPEKLIEFQVPNHFRNKLKEGEDFITEEGEIINNDSLSVPGEDSKSYAYCSDTIYLPKLANYIKGVDLLYHEATFQKDNEARAKKTFHSTAEQAATIAKGAGVKKLLIGHFSNRYGGDGGFVAEAKDIFFNSEAAEEGKIYPI